MKRILMVSNTPPFPPHHGSSQRTNLLMRAMREFAEVDLVITTRYLHHWEPETLDALRADWRMVHSVNVPVLPEPAVIKALGRVLPTSVRYGLGHALTPRSREYAPAPESLSYLEKRVAEKRYDLIVGRFLQPTSLAGGLEFTPVVCDVDDLDTQKMRSGLEHAGGLKAVTRLHLSQLERLVPELLARCAHTWVTARPDVDEMARQGMTRVSILPNIAWLSEGDEQNPRPTAPPPADSQVMLFVGTMDWKPNPDGVDHFLKHSWPAVRAAVPAARLRIVGKNMRPTDLARWKDIPGVEPVGFVEDLAAEYAAAAFALGAVHTGGGSKIKVLEALAHERTCVVTRHSHRGYEHALKHGESLLEGYTDETFAEGCIRLLKDPGLRDAMAARGKALAAKHFSFDGFRTIVRNDIERVLVTYPGGVRLRNAVPVPATREEGLPAPASV